MTRHTRRVEVKSPFVTSATLTGGHDGVDRVWSTSVAVAPQEMTTMPVRRSVYPTDKHDWRDDAKCAGVDYYYRILQLCDTCPVWRQCLDLGTSQQLTGPYGGLPLLKGEITLDSKVDW